MCGLTCESRAVICAGKCRNMNDMQQVVAGMSELNERFLAAEASAAEAERQPQATQQELMRSQAGAKRKGTFLTESPQQEQGIGAFALKYQPSPFEDEDDKWKEWTRVFRSWSGPFFVGAEIYDHIESHRNDSGTIQDLTLTSLRFDAGLICNISTELYHVLIMSTRRRAQRLVLKAKELEGWRRIDFFSGDMNRFRRSQQSQNLWICWQPRSVVISWIL